MCQYMCFPAMTWNACMYQTYMQETSKLENILRTHFWLHLSNPPVIRKFEMHCHSFPWSASKFYDIWTGSWNSKLQKKPSQRGILNLFSLMHIHTENAHILLFWHTHSNSRHVPVHVFFLLWRGMRACTKHTCKKPANSNIVCERTSDCIWVIRKFEMHCHSFQWSASKFYDIWTGSWNSNSKRNRLNGAF